MDSALNDTLSVLLASYGIVLTLVLLLVVVLVSAIGVFGRSWLERVAKQRLEKELEGHRAQLALAAEAARAEHQRRLHELSLFSMERHRAYALTYRRLLRAEGAWTKLARSWGHSDYDDATREEIEEYLRRNRVAKPLARRALDAWERNASHGGKEIDIAVDGARTRRATTIFQKFVNTSLVNELYFSAEVSAALGAAKQALSGLIAEVTVRERGRHDELAAKQAAAQGSVATVRRRMQADLRDRNELPPVQAADSAALNTR